MRIGTFNLNNLFGRFNFHGAVDEIEQGHDTVTVTYTFTDPDDYRLERDSHGLLVAKPADERDTLAQRIGNAGLDLLAVQEVEDLDTLQRFNRDHLDGDFGHLALLEGNDPRFIDVAVLSRHPLGATTSWQHAVHPDAPDRRVFGRDLLESTSSPRPGAGGCCGCMWGMPRATTSTGGCAATPATRPSRTPTFGGGSRPRWPPRSSRPAPAPTAPTWCWATSTTRPTAPGWHR